MIQSEKRFGNSHLRSYHKASAGDISFNAVELQKPIEGKGKGWS